MKPLLVSEQECSEEYPYLVPNSQVRHMVTEACFSRSVKSKEVPTTRETGQGKDWTG